MLSYWNEIIKEDLPILAHFQKIPSSLKDRHNNKNYKQEELFASINYPERNVQWHGGGVSH